MRTINLGIVAHVDAGKTSLTERLLYAAGAIDELGSVDQGTTRTDTLDLERRRGITIRSAVVSFEIAGTIVNLIDTPGHPDFIAEVERTLGVLDGAVLVISAVEGVQPQTRILMRALRRLRIPTLIFVNKIDRGGVQHEGLLDAIAERLGITVVPMTAPVDLGSRAAAVAAVRSGDPAGRAVLVEALADRDDDLLTAFVDDESAVSSDRLERALVEQVAGCAVHPVFFGSALTGAGVPELAAGVAWLLPAAGQELAGPPAATVFKIERGVAGEKVAFLRMFSGVLRVRDRVPTRGRAGGTDTVTGIAVFEGGAQVRRSSVNAGQIGRCWGLSGARIGDRIGGPAGRGPAVEFGLPSLETVVLPVDPADRGRLHDALTELAEQDPLIDLRRDPLRREIAVTLYGEVQKEVIQATLAEEYGIAVGFRASTPVCIERLAGTGAAVEFMHRPPNPFLATVGLRLEPAPPGSGVRFTLDVELGSMPPVFFRAVEESSRSALRQGLHGWAVPDCAVIMTHSGYAPRQSHMHQKFNKAMSSTGRDFRLLTPLVLMAALRLAGTRVHEPIHRLRLDLPADRLDVVLPALARIAARTDVPEIRGSTCQVRGEIPAAQVHALRQRLPALTGGEGLLETAFAHYAPVPGPSPSRPRTDNDPLHREEYLLRVQRRVVS